MIAAVLGRQVGDGAGDAAAEKSQALLEVAGVTVVQQLSVPGHIIVINTRSATADYHYQDQPEHKKMAYMFGLKCAQMYIAWSKCKDTINTLHKMG